MDEHLIGDRAFQDCLELTTISIPESVVEIKGKAFKNCAKLTSITLPNSLTIVSKDSFDFEIYSQIKEIRVPHGQKQRFCELFQRNAIKNKMIEY